jgi:hypothetical protein
MFQGSEKSEYDVAPKKPNYIPPWDCKRVPIVVPCGSLLLRQNGPEGDAANCSGILKPVTCEMI